MSFDALTLAAVRDELDATVVGGKIARVFLPDELGLAFELYDRQCARWLYCSAHPQDARVHLVSQRPARPSDDVTPLLLLVRKYARNGRLESVEQEPRERVLRLRFRKRDADREQEWRTALVVEVMGRHSNLILLDQANVILDSVKRIGPRLSRHRLVLPRQPYRLPPPQVKTSPATASGANLAATASGLAADLPLWRLLVAQVQACSPLLAQEVAYRALATTQVAVGEVRDWDAVALALRELFALAEAHAWQPCLAYGADGQVVAFAPYRLTQIADVRAAPGVSLAVEAYFGRPIRAPGDEARRRRLRQALEEHRKRLTRKLESLRQQLAAPESIERLRREGEHILAYQHIVQPRQSDLVVPEAGVRLVLDPALTPVENAQARFREYARAKAAGSEVPGLISETEHQLAYVDGTLALLDAATSATDVAQLESEWHEISGQWSVAGGRSRSGEKTQGSTGAGAKRRRRGAGRAYARLTVDGIVVLVGRTGRGNDAVLKAAAPTDLWLHARGAPGAHVIVRAGGQEVPEHVLRTAASLAAGHSQARRAAAVAVDFTARRYVGRITGAPPGLVTYRNERTIHVRPLAAEEVA